MQVQSDYNIKLEFNVDLNAECEVAKTLSRGKLFHNSRTLVRERLPACKLSTWADESNKSTFLIPIVQKLSRLRGRLITNLCSFCKHCQMYNYTKLFCIFQICIHPFTVNG